MLKSQKLGAGIYKTILSLTLITILGGIYYQFLNSTKFKVVESDIEYKFSPDLSTKQSEFESIKTKVLSLKEPSAADAVILSDLYVSEAKKTGSISYFDEAEKWVQYVLKSTPANTPTFNEAQRVSANILIAQHEFDAALALIQSTYGQTKTPEASYLKILIYLAQNKFDEAFAEVTYLIKVRPDMGSATLKALVLGHLGQDDLAFYYFKRALQLEDISEESQSVITRAQFAQFLIKKGNYDDAILLCDSALKIIPTNAFAKHVKASALNAQKHYEKAYKILSEAFAETKDPAYLLQMVYSLKLMNKEADFKTLSAEALKAFKSEVEQNRYGHLADLAGLYYVTGDYESSMKILTQDQQTKKTFRTDIMLAKNLIQVKKLDQARDILERQIAKNSTDAGLYHLMPEVLTGDFNKNLRKLFLSKAKMANKNFNSDLLLKIP